MPPFPLWLPAGSPAAFNQCAISHQSALVRFMWVHFRFADIATFVISIDWNVFSGLIHVVLAHAPLYSSDLQLFLHF